jgi:homoserine dehydrogenase
VIPGPAAARSLSILQIGRGRVGGALAAQIAAARAGIAARHGIDLVQVAVAGRAEAAVAIETARRDLAGPRLLVDATDADGMAAVHARGIADGFHVVTCNKKPLAGPFEDWRRLHEGARTARRFYLHEVTVGAGLPILSTLTELVETGDDVVSIEGCVSGTLNFLCVAIEQGALFSEALADARARGFTEPDPREDLAGADVARKAIILARTIGLPIEPDGAAAAPFCLFDPAVSREAFLAGAAALDQPIAARFAAAAGRGRRVRYVARVAPPATCEAGLREIEADGPLGRLEGPENIFVVRTRRYHQHPMVVGGPGAGPDVTAAGAFGDILKVARALARTGERDCENGD